MRAATAEFRLKKINGWSENKTTFSLIVDLSGN
jgi:hypothetical protein